MPKTHSRCNVTVRVTNGEHIASCNPNPVVVKRSQNNGVEWVLNTPGYTFTDINITAGNATDFGEPQISTCDGGKSCMSVSDTVADLGFYSYTICYKDDAGNTYGHDPQIHNEE